MCCINPPTLSHRRSCASPALDGGVSTSGEVGLPHYAILKFDGAVRSKRLDDQSWFDSGCPLRDIILSTSLALPWPLVVFPRHCLHHTAAFSEGADVQRVPGYRTAGQGLPALPGPPRIALANNHAWTNPHRGPLGCESQLRVERPCIQATPPKGTVLYSNVACDKQATAVDHRGRPLSILSPGHWQSLMPHVESWVHGPEIRLCESLDADDHDAPSGCIHSSAGVLDFGASGG
ncbi:hypothetical protein B0H17DRAFT_1127071 [Mycena rosella]|uniref:Uncharacterized protein n=1 Tax=Mycena rosella TaxID=1033263 RepID=A0AAD7M6X3_MYCRO|nr:hypothetical protein B0H17DRAFT_1127071 [Mycena rosella]